MQCSVCGYIPDDDDINITSYNINICNTCGQENVCDLCRSYKPEEIDKIQFGTTKCSCPKCNDWDLSKLPGSNRKLWLEDEY